MQAEALTAPGEALVESFSTRLVRVAERLRTAPIHVLAVLADVGPVAFAAAVLGASPLQVVAFTVVTFGLVRGTWDRRRLAPAPIAGSMRLIANVALGATVVSLLPIEGAALSRLGWSVPIAVPTILALRALTVGLQRALRRRGVGLKPTAIIGAGPTAVELARTLAKRPEFGLVPVGFLDDTEPDGSELPLLGDPRDLASLILASDIRNVVVAFGRAREETLIPSLRDCAGLPFEVSVFAVPRLYELGVTAPGEVDDVWGVPLIRLRDATGRRRGWVWKRVFDIAVSSTLLLLLAPLLVAIALAVAISSPGPVLFRQKRIGQWGRPFEVLKFRSMAVNDEGDTQWSVANDDRITPLGRFIRPTHLDELPQLVNVLRGDMSIVGPRPERPVFVDQFTVEIPRYEDRHRVPVGITGWAQVHGLWGDTSITDRARFDNRYVEDWSLLLDLRILLRTMPSFFGRASARS